MKNTEFCQNLLLHFDRNGKAIVSLIVALASNIGAKSVTELALNPVYHYQYSSICDAINDVFIHNKDTVTHAQKTAERLAFDEKSQIIFKDFLPPLWQGKYRLLNIDVTPVIRPYSPTLENKEMVHVANNVISSNKPISIGLNLSVIGLCAREGDISWNLPLSMQKVPIDMKSSQFAAKQLNQIVTNAKLFACDIIINTSDSAYCNAGFTCPTYVHENLINISRIANHRNVFHQFEGKQHEGRGRHTEYGAIFKIGSPSTHSAPDQTAEFEVTLKKNQRKCTVIAKQYNNMILKGKRNSKMSDKPFQLISIQVLDAQTNEKVFQKTLWLTVWGQRRNELSIKEVYEAFRLRFDIEFFFRFGKQKLLLDKLQSPETVHVENWFDIVKYSYWLLYLSRNEGEKNIRKWEQYLPQYKNQSIKEPICNIAKSPTQTQRAMPKIISEFAQKYLVPKVRNKSSGRKKGQLQAPRQRFEVVIKGKKKKKKSPV